MAIDCCTCIILYLFLFAITCSMLCPYLFWGWIRRTSALLEGRRLHGVFVEIWFAIALNSKLAGSCWHRKDHEMEVVLLYRQGNTTFVKSLNVLSEVCSVQDLWSFWWPGCLAPCSGLLASSKSLAHILVMGIPRHLYFLHDISLQDSSCPMGHALIFEDCSPEGSQS